MESATFDLYRDIAERTDGDVYLGVVGPVRTGKSTFITRLMELLVMPKIPEGARKERIADELPQSGSGRTIMTTQPQFVPNEAVTVSLSDNAPVRVRLVDSVGYMVRGALGSVDKTGSRMVHTPWYDHDIPFEQAAEVGTRKVMTDHATIGVVVTTDGTIAELPRSAYIEAENRVVSELKALGKPFVIILNSAVPNSPDAQTLRTDLQEAYGVPVMLMSVKDMQSADVQKVLESVLLEFPVRQVRLSVPKWLEALDEGALSRAGSADGAEEGGAGDAPDARDEPTDACVRIVQRVGWRAAGTASARRGANRPVADDEGRDVQPHSGRGMRHRNPRR